MNPMFIVAIPLVLVIVGMVLNSIGHSFDQPPSSAEQDPAKTTAAESEAYRRLFDRQRSQAVKRQKRVGQYAWLLMVAIIGFFSNHPQPASWRPSRKKEFRKRKFHPGRCHN